MLAQLRHLPGHNLNSSSCLELRYSVTYGYRLLCRSTRFEEDSSPCTYRTFPREVAPLDQDETAEARSLWRQLQIALWLLKRAPQPAHSWGERPLAMLIEILRFLLESPDPRWRALL